MSERMGNFRFAVIGGIAVFVSGIAVDLALMGHERRIVVPCLLANCIAGLIAIIVVLALQLHKEERHFRFATEKAATMAELNHHVRNAVFPLFLAVQRSHDPRIEPAGGRGHVAARNRAARCSRRRLHGKDSLCG